MKNNLKYGLQLKIITKYLNAEDYLEFYLSFLLVRFKSKYGKN